MDFRLPIFDFRLRSGIENQKIKMACAVSMACCLIFLSSVAESSFDDRGGVRPMGMGGAFVALADDTSAIMFNPAGLGQIKKAEFAAAYDKLYAGLGDDSLGRGLISYVYPSQFYGAFAVNTTMLHTPLYKETTVTFGYGRALGSLYLGMNAKGLFASFDTNDYTELDPLFNNGTSTNGVAIDLGMLYKITDSISFGLAALNVNQPNMALSEDAESKVPVTLQTGIALKLGNTVPTLDLTYRSKKLSDKQDINFHFGMESWLAGESVALRAGVNLYDMAVGASYIINHGNSMDAQLDYAFRYPLVFKEDSISGVYGSHQFSLNVRFGGFSAVNTEPDAIEADTEPIEAGNPQAEVAQLMSKVEKCRKDGKYEEAVGFCNEILEKNFDGALKYHLEANLLMGNTLVKLGRYEEAVKTLEMAEKMASRDPRTHYELAMAYKKYGNQTDNVSWYNKAIIQFEKTRMIDSEYRDVSGQLSELYRRR